MPAITDPYLAAMLKAQQGIAKIVTENGTADAATLAALSNTGKVIGELQMALEAAGKPPVVTPPAPSNRYLGINLGDAARKNYGTNRLWLDRLKTADATWTIDGLPANTPLDLDVNGWPNSIPKGAYNLNAFFALDGHGSGETETRYAILTNKPDITATIVGTALPNLSKPGVQVFQPYDYYQDVADPLQGAASFAISKTTPMKAGEYVAIVRYDKVAAYLAGERYETATTAKLNRFAAVRAMDWMQTNSSPYEKYEDLPAPGAWSYGASVPVSVICQTANDLGNLDAEIPVPHQFDDASCDKLFAEIKAKLKGRYSCAYSNEAGWQFSVGMNQGLWLNTQGSSWDYMRKYAHALTGSVNNGVLTVTKAPVGFLIGQYNAIIDGGVNTDSYISTQLSGTPGGIGAYQLGTRVNGGTGPNNQTLPSGTFNVAPLTSAPIQYYGYRATQVIQRAIKAYAGQRDRLVTNMGFQFAGVGEGASYRLDGALQAARELGISNPKTFADCGFDAGQVAWYFGLPCDEAADRASIVQWARGGSAGLDAAFKALMYGTGLVSTTPWSSIAEIGKTLAQWKTTMDAQGLHLEGYEGGHAMAILGYSAADHDAVMDLRDRMRADSRMADCYGMVYDFWTKAGGKRLYQFADFQTRYSDGGDWYVWQNARDPETPASKWMADINGVTVS